MLGGKLSGSDNDERAEFEKHPTPLAGLIVATRKE
jgi:hypothetical protein